MVQIDPARVRDAVILPQSAIGGVSFSALQDIACLVDAIDCAVGEDDAEGAMAPAADGGGEITNEIIPLGQQE